MDTKMGIKQNQNNLSKQSVECKEHLQLNLAI